MTSALLVLDMQRDFLEPNGKLPLPVAEVEPLIAATNRAIATAAQHGWPVIYIVNEFKKNDWQNIFRNGAAVAGTPGTALDERIAVVGDERFAKHTGNAFSNAALGERLAALAVDHVLIGGVYADACVLATAKGARARGLTVTVVTDAIATASRRRLARAITQYTRAGIGLTTSVVLESPTTPAAPSTARGR